MLGKAQEEILPGLSANGEELLSPGGAAALLQRQLDAHPQAAQRAVLETQAATAGLGDVARDAQAQAMAADLLVEPGTPLVMPRAKSNGDSAR